MLRRICSLGIAVSGGVFVLPLSADDVLYRYDGDVLPHDSSAGWDIANPCDGPCSEGVENGHFELQWSDGGNLVNYNLTIAGPPAPPPTLWVEWRYRSDTPFPLHTFTCDGRFRVKYGGMLEVVYVFGDAAFSASGDDWVIDLDINEFQTYRYESLDGVNYRVAVDGLVFIEGARDNPNGLHSIQFGGDGGCVLEQLPTLNEWDFIRYGTIAFGEQIVASNPRSGFLDPAVYTTLDRFTVTFDSANYVYLDDITVEVTGGTAPGVIQTRRLDNGEPEVVEIVLDGPLPLNETTRFTFDDGTAVNMVEYTLASEGPCCLPGGLCEVLGVADCQLSGGSMVGGACEGDIDGDGVDGVCGDPCPLDNLDDSDGDGLCDSADPCPNDNPDDTDNDGTCDSEDACPTNPAFAADPGPCNCSSSDLDGDGILDCLDVCPGFDDNLDTDGDGVRDCQDQCPGADDAVFAPECTVAIPTTTAWGLVVLGLLLLTLAKLAWARRQRAAM